MIVTIYTSGEVMMEPECKATANTMWSGKVSNRCALHRVLASSSSFHLILSPCMWKRHMPGRQHNEGK